MLAGVVEDAVSKADRANEPVGHSTGMHTWLLQVDREGDDTKLIRDCPVHTAR